MVYIPSFVRAAATMLLVAMPSSVSAITINETLSRLTSSSYGWQLGFARAGLVFSLSTNDNWQTADFDFMIRSHAKMNMSDIYVEFADAPSGLTAADVRGAGSQWPNTNPYLFYTHLTGANNDRVGFSLVSSDPSHSAWDQLSSSGFRVGHYFFGAEYGNVADILLNNREISSYRMQLGDAAAVPLPPAIGLGVACLGSLALLKRKRKKKYPGEDHKGPRRGVVL